MRNGVSVQLTEALQHLSEDESGELFAMTRFLAKSYQIAKFSVRRDNRHFELAIDGIFVNEGFNVDTQPLISSLQVPEMVF